MGIFKLFLLSISAAFLIASCNGDGNVTAAAAVTGEALPGKVKVL